jgi:hypothetical protein
MKKLIIMSIFINIIFSISNESNNKNYIFKIKELKEQIKNKIPINSNIDDLKSNIIPVNTNDININQSLSLNNIEVIKLDSELKILKKNIYFLKFSKLEDKEKKEEKIKNKINKLKELYENNILSEKININKLLNIDFDKITEDDSSDFDEANKIINENIKKELK